MLRESRALDDRVVVEQEKNNEQRDRQTTRMSTPVVSANFSAVRARSYVYRLPLFTRLLLFTIVAAWFATVALGDVFNVKAWGALVPEEVGLTSCMSP